MTFGYTLIELLVVLVIMSCVATVAGASIPWPVADGDAPAEAYRELMLRSREAALRDGVRVILQLERDGTYTTTRLDGHGEHRAGGNLITSCTSPMVIPRAARYVFDPGGLVLGDTLHIECGGATAAVYANALTGSIHVDP
jgi:prepilin-type N-terminal cleavage/methylation domain-containing protein